MSFGVSLIVYLLSELMDNHYVNHINLLDMLNQLLNVSQRFHCVFFCNFITQFEVSNTSASFLAGTIPLQIVSANVSRN